VLVVEALGSYPKDRVAPGYVADDSAHDIVQRQARIIGDLGSMVPEELDTSVLL